MKETKEDPNFNKIVDNYINDMKRYGVLKNGSVNGYRSGLKLVHDWNKWNSIVWVENALLEKSSIEKVEYFFDEFYKSNNSINNVRDKRSIYLSFAKWIIGQYQANTWLSIDKSSDLVYCQLIAKNALFCTIDVAENVRDGKSGYGERGHKESDTYSWFDNKYRRISSEDKKNGKKIRDEDKGVILDNNTMANLAIKNAIKKSLPIKGKFSDYMACHIWDKTCYIARYHTSVFNLVLVPTAIAGLTDYNQAVKEMLQYESARRFGVYPKEVCPDPPTKPTFYDKITIWRQQDEHDKAAAAHKPFNGV